MSALVVIEWDTLNGDILGATVLCPDCPCDLSGTCSGSGRLHRPYRLPNGGFIDFYGDADVLMKLLDRTMPAAAAVPPGEPQP